MVDQENNISWRVKKLEERVEVLGARTHELASIATENRLNVAFIKGQLEKTADKDDMDRVENQLMSVQHMLSKATVAIIGTTLSATVGLVVAILTHTI